MKATSSIVVAGLPSSGKTTFLAALWYLVFGREAPTELSFSNLVQGDYKHLNEIADRWLRAQEQDRTLPGDNQIVSFSLLDAEQAPIRITFPDVAGEMYSGMWEYRECPASFGEMLQGGNVLLFINANRIVHPLRVIEVTQQVNALEGVGGDEPEVDDEPVDWLPKFAPTQVQLVSLLSSLADEPLDVGHRKLCVMLSAWDKAKGEGLCPRDFLAAKLPFLHQYLLTNGASWDYAVYGVSAQGGDYDGKDVKREQAEQLREMNEPSKRIRLTEDGHSESYDLTVPIAWLAK